MCILTVRCDLSKVLNRTLIKADENKVISEIKYENNYEEKYNEIALVAGDNNINDSLLYSLGIKNRTNLMTDLQEIRKNENILLKNQNIHMKIYNQNFVYMK